MKTIYVDVYTSGLTKLANQVAVQFDPHSESEMRVVSDLANDIAKENNLDWTRVLVQYSETLNGSSCIGKVIPMKPIEELTREQALKWWNNLKIESQRLLFRAYSIDNVTPARYETELTGREIEEIYKKETQNNLELANQALDEQYSKYYNSNNQGNEFQGIINDNIKLNQKQFKEFNNELFLAYINKFSLKDRYNAAAIILLTLELSIDDLNLITNILINTRDKKTDK